MNVLEVVRKEWQFRHMQKVRICYLPYHFIVNDCIREGRIFGVLEAYYTKNGVYMYTLCGAVGTFIPWRNKVMARFCEPVPFWRYLIERYLFPNKRSD